MLHVISISMYHYLTVMLSYQYTNDHHHGQGEHEQAPIISYTYTVHLNPITTEFCPQQTIHIQAFSWATHI